MTRVSIVIPVYNGANYLAEAIDSALAQTYGDVEVLVVNDGSTDAGATAAIVRGYGERIRYIEKPNGGVSSALNTGLHEMRGEWFCWLSHDDRYLPLKTEKQLAFADASGAKIVGCDFEIIDGRGNVAGVQRLPIDAVRNGRDLLDHYVFGCALMIHRSCFDRLRFNEDNRTTQDLEMWIRLVEHHPIAWLHEVLAQVRFHAAQGSRVEVGYAADKASLFARLADEFDATYFDPSAKTPRERAAIYDWLAFNALTRQSLDGASHALRRAWREMPSLRNPALAHILLGPRNWLRSGRARAFLTGKSRSLLRRLGPG
jgi:glycosyltransferase involved in cell wall biosynthesis